MRSWELKGKLSCIKIEKKCSLHLCALNVTGEEADESKNMN